MNKKTASKVLMILLAVVVFGFIIYKTDWAATKDAISGVNYGLVLLGALIMTISHYLRGYRWSILGKSAGYPLNKRRAFYSVMSGYLVNAATSRGGEVARCALTAKSEKAPVETLIGTVITERIIDLITMLIMALLALAVQFNVLWSFAYDFVLEPLAQNWQWITLFVVGAVLSFFLIKKFSPKKEKSADGFLSKFLSGLNSFFEIPKKGPFILVSFGIWLGYWLSLYLQLEALQITEHMNIANALAVLMFSSLGIIIPVPGGAGVWYSIAYGLQMVYGFSESNATTFGIFTVAFSNIFHVLLGGISYALLFFEVQRLDLPQNDGENLEQREAGITSSES